MSELRQKILAASDMREEAIHVDEWGVDVLVRGMTGRERAKWGEQSSKGTAGVNLVILCAYDPATGKKDPDGNWVEQPERIFHATDRDGLLEKSGAALDKVCDVALRLNGLDGISTKQAEETLPSAPNGASSGS